MKRIELTRQSITNVDFEKMDEMLAALEELLHEEPDVNNDIWRGNIATIIHFKDGQGSFSLLDTFQVESDIRVDYCYMPTYLCTAILMKALMTDKDLLTGKEDIILPDALEMCCGRGLKGHGYSGFKGLLKAIDIFMEAGVREFLWYYPNLCVKFTDMFESIKNGFAMRVQNREYTADWMEDFRQEIITVNEYFSKQVVFVYGTLLEGQSNHSHFLGNSEYVAKATITGFDMYDIGTFPGIVKGKGTVKGEIYAVDLETMGNLDYLEGEGTLYIRRCARIRFENGYAGFAHVYVYNDDTNGFTQITEEMQPYSVDWKKNLSGYVWYVSYGSNMSEERLRYYIQGGLCVNNGKTYFGCTDKTMPEKSVPVEIPFDMYYSNYDMGSWENSAVSFIDISKAGKSYGRAYLVRENQIDEIHIAEGRGSSWYPEKIRLADIGGIPAYTFAGGTTASKEPFAMVSAEYAMVLFMGMKETYPDMSDKEVIDYLRSCGSC